MDPQTYDILELPTLLPPTYERINEISLNASGIHKTNIFYL